MHSSTKFQLDNSNFAQVRRFRGNFQKVPNLKKFDRFNRFWPNSIPKVHDRYIIFVYSFKTIAEILRKLEPPQIFFNKFKNWVKKCKVSSKCVAISYWDFKKLGPRQIEASGTRIEWLLKVICKPPSTFVEDIFTYNISESFFYISLF